MLRHDVLSVDVQNIDDQNPSRVAIMPAWIVLLRDVVLERPLSPFNVAWSESSAALD
jgi:hypothetical protein